MQILPLTDADAERLIDASVLAPLVDEPGPRARAALVDLLLRLAALADAVPEIVAVRLNPVLVVDGSAAITDVRIALAPVTSPTPAPGSAASDARRLTAAGRGPARRGCCGGSGWCRP